MSIRLLEGTSIIPTSVKEGNLLFHGFNMNVVASIPLPFKRKFNGPICAEVIEAPNVRVLTELDDGMLLVMRFDGSWTIYTSSMVPLYYGEFSNQEVFSPYLTVDPFGSLTYIPKGYKKQRAYKSYLVRYTQSNELHYISEGWTNGMVFTDTDNPVFKKLFVEGLNAGIQHHPSLSVLSDVNAIYYQNYYPIYVQHMDVTISALQGRIAVCPMTIPRNYVTLARRHAFAEVEEYLENPTYIPNYIESMIDCSMLKEYVNSDSGLTTPETHKYMDYIMQKNPEFILAFEICGNAVVFVDRLGRIYYSAPATYWESGLNVGECAGAVRHFETDTKLVGFAVKRVTDISAPTVLPRVPAKGNKVWIHGKELDIKETIADRPDKTFAGYQESVLKDKDAVIYLADGSYIIV